MPEHENLYFDRIETPIAINPDELRRFGDAGASGAGAGQIAVSQAHLCQLKPVAAGFWVVRYLPAQGKQCLEGSATRLSVGADGQRAHQPGNFPIGQFVEG